MKRPVNLGPEGQAEGRAVGPRARVWIFLCSLKADEASHLDLREREREYASGCLGSWQEFTLQPVPFPAFHSLSVPSSIASCLSGLSAPPLRPQAPVHLPPVEAGDGTQPVNPLPILGLPRGSVPGLNNHENT